jgi:hypothetical protein
MQISKLIFTNASGCTKKCKNIAIDACIREGRIVNSLGNLLKNAYNFRHESLITK